MGPHHRSERRSPQHDTWKNICPNQTRTGSAGRIHPRAPEEGIYQTIEEPLHYPLLLHKKERQETVTSTRLPETQPMDHLQSIPPTTHPETNKPSKRSISVLQDGRSLGI